MFVCTYLKHALAYNDQMCLKWKTTHDFFSEKYLSRPAI